MNISGSTFSNDKRRLGEKIGNGDGSRGSDSGSKEKYERSELAEAGDSSSHREEESHWRELELGGHSGPGSEVGVSDIGNSAWRGEEGGAKGIGGRIWCAVGDTGDASDIIPVFGWQGSVQLGQRFEDPLSHCKRGVSQFENDR